MITFRPTTAADVTTVNEILFASKAYWEYPPEYLLPALELMRFTPEEVSEPLSWLISDDEGPQGFLQLRLDEGRPTLEHLWIHPRRIRRGFGTAALRHMRTNALEAGWKEIVTLPDPPAEGFYLAFGFVDTGERVASRLATGPVFKRFRYAVER